MYNTKNMYLNVGAPIVSINFPYKLATAIEYPNQL